MRLERPIADGPRTRLQRWRARGCAFTRTRPLCWTRAGQGRPRTAAEVAALEIPLRGAEHIRTPARADRTASMTRPRGREGAARPPATGGAPAGSGLRCASAWARPSSPPADAGQRARAARKTPGAEYYRRRQGRGRAPHRGRSSSARATSARTRGPVEDATRLVRVARRRAVRASRSARNFLHSPRTSQLSGSTPGAGSSGGAPRRAPPEPPGSRPTIPPWRPGRS